MIRYGLGVLAMAAGLALPAPLFQAQAQSLTIPPDLRAPGEATAPQAAERSKPRAAKSQKTKAAPREAGKRSLGVPGSSQSKASTASQAPQREYPPELDRSTRADEPRIRPSVTPSGMGLGGRF